jgi:trk system potassium uptake protein
MTLSVPGRSRPAERLPHPGRIIAGGFATAIAVGTALLSTPLAAAGPERASLEDALFTATSAVCVTGLVTVDTGSYWSGFGQGVILLLIQLGGLGIMTVASLVAILFSRRLGFRTRLIAQAETKALTAADIRRLIGRIVLFSLTCEAAAAVVLTGRFALAYDEKPGRAVYSGVFHAISAFNNAGFGLHPDSLVRYVADPWVSLTVAVAVIVGGLGFLVVFELRGSWHRPKTWSVLTHLTVTVTVALLVIGTVGITVAEATNPDTLGPLTQRQTLVAGFFTAVMPRTAGFNSVDTAALRPETLLFTDALMFIGGGSAGTAGGIKVTTFGLLAYVLWAEMRGHPDVEVGRRKIPSTNQRQGLSIALLAIGLIFAATVALQVLTGFAFEQVLFEAISGFSTVGLSTGITPDLPLPAHLLVVALMFIGRIGPLTLASALALRERGRLRELPEERTIVG